MSTEGIPGSEGEPRGTKQVKVRVREDVADAYDAVCERDGKSRAQSLREHMTATVEADTDDREDEDGRQPPSDPELAEAWDHLKRLSRGRHLRRSRACAYLAVRMQDMDADEAWRLISLLRDRGYARFSTDPGLSTTYVTVRA
ncbi:hypothetical protein [Halomarina oriensis]|uniref:Ribbon-helix-helix protein, CopG family n=1 Tax=Halomarina oriensis TaxID=671145 RepID=A0A6B0GK12_9EURY|nr:hypothetical protein [Halomarina oriensis]MWG34167.1 hypothetical protein [Halomarina oriensis]